MAGSGKNIMSKRKDDTMVEKTFTPEQLNLRLECTNLLRAVAEYIDYIYESENDFDYEDLCDAIVEVVEEKIGMSPDALGDFVKDYSMGNMDYKKKAEEFVEKLTKKDILENLKFSAIDYYKLRLPLKDSKRITFKFLDLTIGYEVLVSKSETNTMTMPVTDTLLEKYKIKEAELYDAAMKNLPSHDEVVVMKSNDGEMAGIHYKNDNKLGPLLLMDKTAIREYANKEGNDLYISLMSIHDICCIPFKEGDSHTIKKMGFREIVEEINGQIDREDIGSYSVYYYDRAADELTLAVKGRNDP